MTGQPEVTHHSSHRTLLANAEPGDDRTVDAVVVPAARPAHHLQTAMLLAKKLDAVLVMLCSGAADAKRAGSYANEVNGLRWLAIDIPKGYRLHLVRLETSFAEARTASDLSVKRNLGLLLARQAGWQSLLFLDDDIVEVDAATVRAAARRLVPGGAVGIPAREFPDNSVVCHANRLVNPFQDVFVSGSALIVDCGTIESFFPRIYNEDWLFLAPALARGAVSSVGRSVQLEYDPFGNPARAKSEEFGDVLAEGLVALLHSGKSFDDADADYWAIFLELRRQLVRRIKRDLRQCRMDFERNLKVRRSLWAADRRRREITADLLAAYVAAWQADRKAWRAAVEHLVPDRTVSFALATLGLASTTIASSDVVAPVLQG